MKLWWQDGGVQVWHGDCRDLDADMVDPGTVDLLLTDPPYGRQYRGYGQITQNANIAADGARQGMRTLRGSLSALDELLSPTAHLLVMCHWQSWPDFYDSVASHAKMERRGLVRWTTVGQGRFRTWGWVRRKRADGEVLEVGRLF